MYHDDLSEKIFTRRAFVVGALQLVGVTVLGARLAWLQVAQGSRYKMLSDKNRINIKMLLPLRGQIVDRFGVPLAVNNQIYRVVIVREQAGDLEKSLAELQKVIAVEERDIQRVIKESKKTAKFIPLRVKEELSWEEVARIEVHLPYLPGVSIERGEIRSYPYKDSTAHLVGYVRNVSPKDLEDDDDPVLKLPGFKLGKTGVERTYDKQLRGKAGASEVEVNVIGREVRELRRRDASLGDRVTLTIDGELQRFTQEILATHKSASAVIMDAHTGAVYAMASHPAFDPNMFVRGFSQEDWQIIMNDPGRPQTNKAISGQYPPGSTFKMVTALAGLRANVINKHTTVFCPGHYEYGDSRFHCWKKTGHGRVDLDMALAQSCDVYFYKMATEVGIDAIAEMARELGLGEALGIELAEEAGGLIPDIAWKKRVLGRSWQPGETIVCSIGQGAVQATPLQLAVMTARMVNGGYAVKPWITGFVGETFYGKEEAEKLNIPQEHLDLVMKGMDMVVNHPRGTAHKSRIEEEGKEMAGKTGTAQVQSITKEQRRLGVKNENLPWKQRHHALFVGYAPVNNPRYVCAVVVEHGVGGSSAAAPLAKELLVQAQARDPAITNMQPEKIDNQEVLQSWPPRKPKDTGANTNDEGAQ